ncbi:hypothetical protein GCM10016234_39810 [Tianweitania populi]|uniref:Uncharacterized protein n=1 Tax=Tianweitania populi TaxID=1607949 RepID=A0A8J3DYE3_9HYPH|nr:hypothetical protein GCM10016234_39810 [Tianweitania populi]
MTNKRRKLEDLAQAASRTQRHVSYRLGATNPLSSGMQALEAATHRLKGVETLTSGMEATGKAPSP